MPEIKREDLAKEGKKLYLEKMQKVSNMKALSPIKIKKILESREVKDAKLNS